MRPACSPVQPKLTLQQACWLGGEVLTALGSNSVPGSHVNVWVGFRGSGVPQVLGCTTQHDACSADLETCTAFSVAPFAAG